MTSIVDRIFNLTYARKLELVSTLGLDNTFVRVVIDKCARRNRQVRTCLLANKTGCDKSKVQSALLNYDNHKCYSLSLRDIIYSIL